MRPASLVGPLTVALLACRGHPASQTGPDANDYRAIRARAAADVAQGDSLVVQHIDLGAMSLAADTLRLIVTNETRRAREIGVSIRTEPGLWIRGAWQRGYRLDLAPAERREVVFPYTILRLTPDGRLLLRIGSPDSAAGPVSVDHPAIDRAYRIGIGNPAAADPRDHFEYLRTMHFDLYAYRASPAARDAQAIADARERAIGRIDALLGVTYHGRIRLVFYPDSATKRNETGHIGMGWASNDNIVEIYNDQGQRLDPYHELVHIVAGQVGDPPALFDEGFAVYVSELLGAQALEYLGHAGRTIDQATCDLARENKRVALDSLLSFSEFGSAAAPGDVMYPQGASAVKYLIDTYGLDRFREAYRSIKRGDTHAPASFARVFGQTPATVERAWYERLACDRATGRATQ